MTQGEVARQWIEKADHDLVAARHTLGLGDDCPYDIVCFHAQQAVEKQIKGLLAFNGLRVAKGHDINVLIEQLPESARPALSKTEQVKLSNYAVTVRYPGIGEEPTREDAAEALRLAEATRTFVRGRLDQGIP